jgi:hypothetical protein
VLVTLQLTRCVRRTPHNQFLVRRSDGALQWQPGNDSTTLASPDAAALVAADDGTAGGDAGGGQAALDVYRVNAKVGYGEHFVLVGDQPALGAWDIVRGVRLRWTGCDVWQASASLPRGGGTEYKLVRCAGDGDDIAAVDWLPGDNWTLPPLSSVHASAAGGRPVSRHVHATLPDGWWQPWYWAPELGNADALVYLPDYLPAAPAAPRVASSSSSMEADAPAQQSRSMPAMSDAQRAAALSDASALAAAREQSADGLSMLTGLARAAGSNEQLGAAAVKAASEGLTLDINSPGFATTAARTAVAGAGVAGVATAAAGIAGGDAALMAAMQPVAEAAALGMLVAFGAKNLLFAEDRQRFLEATGSRQKLLKLLKDNMSAIGVAGNADVAAAVSKSAAEAGFEFDPLELLEEEGEGSEEMEEVARTRPAGLRVPAATAAALADEAAGSAAAVLQQDANDMN